MAVSKKSIKDKFFMTFLALGVLFFVGVIFFKPQQQLKLVTNEVGDLSGAYDKTEKLGYFWGKEVTIPTEVNSKKTPVLGVTNADEKWIEIDLSDQRLKAWQGNTLYLETLVSTGLPWFPTPTGEFRIWYKVKYTRMKGGQGAYAYDLPNVPYTMFFENTQVPGWRGYGLHGTYWHNDFGRVRSHGCVNLPTPIAEKLYYWTTPVLGDKNFVRSSTDNTGTKIVIHD